MIRKVMRRVWTGRWQGAQYNDGGITESAMLSLWEERDNVPVDPW